jgi:hypothetical protein
MFQKYQIQNFFVLVIAEYFKKVFLLLFSFFFAAQTIFFGFPIERI